MVTDSKSKSKSLLPVINISPLLAKCDDSDMAEDAGVMEVVQKLDRACRDVGFFYVIGHGISEDLINKTKEIAHQFFELPYEEKLKIKITSANGFRGYQRIGENYTGGKQDMHEAIDTVLQRVQAREVWGHWKSLGRAKPVARESSRVERFDGGVHKTMHRCVLHVISFHGVLDLSRNILRGISLALGGSPYEFEGKMLEDPFWIMRIIGYPSVNKENVIGLGAHTDYGLLSLINQDDDKTALQVKNVDGDWIPAIPIPGSFICNIGDMLTILSNGVYESTLHKVINNSPKYRVCVGFFYEVNFDAEVEPLDIFKQKYPGKESSQVAKRVVYGEHLTNKVLITFANLVEKS